MPVMSEKIPEQIKIIREAAKQGKGYRVMVFDQVVIDSVTNFLIWDDDMQLLYAITANTAREQVTTPFIVRAYDYSWFEMTTIDC